MILGGAVVVTGLIAIAALVVAILGYSDGTLRCVPTGEDGFGCKCGTNYCGERCTEVITQGRPQDTGMFYTVKHEIFAT